jgi:alpha-mannosidase
MGNAHLDPAWLWRWQEGLGEVKSTFRSALDRMKEFDDYVFTASSACYYRWLEEDEPEMFEEIRARVREGRWALVGGWWIEPDCNLPSGESFARQSLLGQRYFLSRFGRTAETGYNIDSFGHNGNLPQILAASGMKNYVFTRPGAHEKDLESTTFRWEGIDGTQVLAVRIPTGYATNDLEVLEKNLAKVKELVDGDEPVGFLSYGVGNHGGGPTIEMLKHLTGLQKTEEDHDLVFAGPDAFFTALRAADGERPVLRDDLQHHAPGCYSAHAGMKRANRMGENALLNAEIYAAMAVKETGSTYPQAELTRAWEGLLFNQFHDILCGCSIRTVHEDAEHLYGECMAIAQRESARATRRIAYRIDTLLGGDPVTAGKDLGRPIVTFNPLAWPVRVPVQVGAREGFGAFDAAGAMVPVQPVQCRHRLWDNQEGIYLAEVPAFGYALHYVRPTREGDAPAPEPEVTVVTEEDEIDRPMCKVAYGAVVLENQHLRVEIDRMAGTVRALHEKATGTQLIDGPAARGLVMEDWHHDTWAHGVTHFNDQVGQFGAAEVTIVERGPVRCVVRSKTVYGDSILTQDFTLYDKGEELTVAVTLDWREKCKTLKLAFPVAVSNPRSFYEIPYGRIERPCNGTEEPGLNWIAVSGKKGDDPCGLALLNDGKYSFSVEGPEMRLTAARSSIYADHGGIRRDEEEYEYLDQGLQRFTYALKPFAGETPPAAVVRSALELNTDFEIVQESYHGGALQQRASHLQVSADNIIVTAFKRAEEGDGTILRAYETEGRATEVSIDCALLQTTLPLVFKPFEVKTIKVTDNGETEETDFLEQS